MKTHWYWFCGVCAVGAFIVSLVLVAAPWWLPVVCVWTGGGEVLDGIGDETYYIQIDRAVLGGARKVTVRRCAGSPSAQNPRPMKGENLILIDVEQTPSVYATRAPQEVLDSFVEGLSKPGCVLKVSIAALGNELQEEGAKEFIWVMLGSEGGGSM